MYWLLLQDENFFSWLSKFEFTPFFWVWVLSLFVWFFLEVSVWAAHYFNTKHTYASEISRLTILFLQSLKLLKNKKKFSFIKIAYVSAV